MDWLYDLLSPGTAALALAKNQNCMSTSTIATTIQSQSCMMATTAYDTKVKEAQTRLAIVAGIAAVVGFFVMKKKS